jgi:small-conductance mechanosensitive channel
MPTNLQDFQKLLQTELARLQMQTISLQTIITAILVFAVALLLIRFLTAALRRLQKRVKPAEASAFYIAEKLGAYVILFIGIIAAVSTLGVDLTSLSLFIGALGVGIGLGLQEIVKNFMSGIVLLLDRSIEVGDFIELDDGVNGVVQSVGARATTIETNDRVHVLIPNSLLVENRLMNWTRNRGTRRIHVPFAVALGSDKEAVRAAALEAAANVPFTLPDDGDRVRTQCWLVGYSDQRLEFELVVWPALDAVKRPGAMMAAYRWAIDDALRKHGLKVPVPQRDLHLRSMFGREGEEAVRVIAPEQAPEPVRETAPAAAPPTRNDAADDVVAEEQRDVQEAVTKLGAP